MPVTIHCDACGAECGGFGNEWHKGTRDGHLTLCRDCSRRARAAVQLIVDEIRLHPKREKMSIFSRLVSWP